jgi:hypothetical protein
MTDLRPCNILDLVVLASFRVVVYLWAPSHRYAILFPGARGHQFRYRFWRVHSGWKSMNGRDTACCSPLPLLLTLVRGQPSLRRHPGPANTHCWFNRVPNGLEMQHQGGRTCSSIWLYSDRPVSLVASTMFPFHSRTPSGKPKSHQRGPGTYTSSRSYPRAPCFRGFRKLSTNV